MLDKSLLLGVQIAFGIQSICADRACLLRSAIIQNVVSQLQVQFCLAASHFLQTLRQRINHGGVVNAQNACINGASEVLVKGHDDLFEETQTLFFRRWSGVLKRW